MKNIESEQAKHICDCKHLFKKKTLVRRNQVLHKPQIARPLPSNCVEKSEKQSVLVLDCIMLDYFFYPLI